MADQIQCPTCQRPLNVPESLVGRPVKCPDCGAVFLTVQGSTSMPGTPAPEAGEASLLARPVAGLESYSDAESRVEVSGATVIAPGIALLIVGALGFMAAALVLLTLLQADERELKAALQGPAQAAEDQEAFEQGFALAVGPVGRAIHGAFALANLVIMLGAVAMMLGRFHGLAVLASILAIVNIDSCCCILGLPVGVWSLLVLMRPDVKEMFH